mgnify:CR=1 FL=1
MLFRSVLIGASALAHFYLSERLGMRKTAAVATQPATTGTDGMAPSFADEDEQPRPPQANRGPQRDDRRSSAGGFMTSDTVLASAEQAPAERDLRVARTAPPGITLQHPPVPLTAADMQRLQQRQYNAQASTHLGVNAGRATDTTTPAAARANEAPRQEAATEDLPNEAPDGAELPPATIGPLSLRLAAQRGDPGAEFEVAARFAEGKGVKTDFKKAMEWYQRAAQKGFVPAQYRLATIHERGLAGKADLQRARVWYKRAAEQGNVKAMHNLAVLSAGREAGTPDYPNAAQWFQEAADRGLADKIGRAHV